MPHLPSRAIPTRITRSADTLQATHSIPHRQHTTHLSLRNRSPQVPVSPSAAPCITAVPPCRDLVARMEFALRKERKNRKESVTSKKTTIRGTMRPDIGVFSFNSFSCCSTMTERHRSCQKQRQRLCVSRRSKKPLFSPFCSCTVMRSTTQSPLRRRKGGTRGARAAAPRSGGDTVLPAPLLKV
jgi:hypothetical protein